MKLRMLYAVAPLALLAGCSQDQTPAQTDTVEDGTMATDSAATDTTLTMPVDSATPSGTATGNDNGMTGTGQPDKSTSGSTAVPETPATGQPTTSDQAGETPPR